MTKMRMKGLLLGALALVLLAACQAQEEMRADINDIRASTVELKRSNDALALRVDALSKSASALEAKLKDLPDKDTVSALGESQTSLLERVNDLTQQFQEINGKVEESKYGIDQSIKQTAAEVEVLKSKVEATEGHTVDPTASISELKTRLDAIEADLATIKGKVAIYDEALKPQPAAAQPKEDPKLLYDKALKAFNGKQYPEARQGFKDFIKQAPDNKLVSNAQFWIGETLFAEKSYDDAILSYEDVIQKYPDSPKAPDAMLKQAYAFLELGDKKAARGILGALIEKFPKNKLAETARKKLSSIK